MTLVGSEMLLYLIMETDVTIRGLFNSEHIWTLFHGTGLNLKPINLLSDCSQLY